MLTVLLNDLINTVFFNLRNKLSFSRPIKTLSNENKEHIFTDIVFKNESQRLLDSYNLADIYNNSSIVNYKETLYTVKLLEDIFDNTQILSNLNSFNILDIGSKNFSYATALYNFFGYYKSTIKREISLDGIEIDPFRIMADFHSRYDYAMYNIANLPNAHYLIGDLLNLTGKTYNLITWFLPFLTETPLLKWGLPIKYLKPKQMFKKAVSLMKPNGIMLLVNQTKNEKELQIKIIKDLELNYIEIEKPYTNIFSPYSFKRCITLVKNF